MKNTEQPAFPIVQDNNIDGNLIMDCSAQGLTKREYFAVKMMTAVLTPTHPDCEGYISLCAQVAVKAADALLVELEK